MNTSLEPSQTEPNRGFPVALVMGAVAVAALVGGLWFFSSRGGGGESSLLPLPFGPEEQKYAERIHFRDFKLSRAENMLGQEVTLIQCTMENAGTGILREVEVELQFHDLENQIILSEKRRLLGRYAAPMGGGRIREVDMNFEKIPPDWNQHAPVIRITGLAYEP